MKTHSARRVRTILRPGEDDDDDDSLSASGDEEPQPVAAAERAACREAPPDGELDPEGMRAWEVLWKDGGGEGRLQRLTFEGSDGTRALLQQHMTAATEAWSVSRTCTDAIQEGVAGANVSI